MSTVSGDDFNNKYGGDIERLARAFPNAIAVYTYREPWNNTLCYKVVNNPEEEEQFLLAPQLGEQRRVWP
jgi:hypothetical protein